MALVICSAYYFPLNYFTKKLIVRKKEKKKTKTNKNEVWKENLSFKNEQSGDFCKILFSSKI